MAQKIVYCFMAVFTIELALFLFGGSTYGNSSLFNMIFNLSSLSTATFYLVIFAALSITAGTIIAGNYYQLNTFAVFSGVAVVALTFVFSIVHLGAFISGELSIFSPEFAKIITMLIVAPLIFVYTISIMEWARGNL